MRGTEDLMGLFQGAPPAETGIPSKVSDFVKKDEVQSKDQSGAGTAVEDCSFRVWQNCKDGLCGRNKMKRAR